MCFLRARTDIPGTIGPMYSEMTIGPRAKSLLTGSHETDMRKPISLIVMVYDEVVTPPISLWMPSGLVCKCIINLFNMKAEYLN